MGFDFVISHTGIWLNIWVFLAIIALVAIIVYFILRRRNMVKMEEELEDILADKYKKEAEMEAGEELEEEGSEEKDTNDSNQAVE